MKNDPTRRELMRALQPYRATFTSEWGRDGWDMARESVIYWFGYRYHGGQWSNLYSVLSTSPYRPGRLESGPEVDEGTMFLYEILEGTFRDEN
jgi:hypothetical protein